MMAKKAVSKRANDSKVPTHAKRAANTLSDASPVYLRSLRVRNVRCFGDEPQTLNFSTSDDASWAPWTILIGNNGTGKSTLLQLLACISLEGVHGSADQTISFEGSFTRQRFEFARCGANNEPFEFNLAIEKRRSTAIFDFFVERGNRKNAPITNDEVVQTTVAWYHGVTEVNSQPGFEPATIRLMHAGYGAWRRIGSSTLSTDNTDLAKSPGHLFDENAELLNAEEWMQRLDYAASKESEIRQRMRQQFKLVRDTLLEILPDVEDIQITHPTKEFPNPRVLFQTPYGLVQLRQLGFGYQSLISWVVDFAARMFDAYPESPNPLAEPAICLIDEIDLHLHPSWQRKVMKYLSERFPRTQFVATAHSPLIVQSAPEIGANVVVLHREGDHVVISNNPIDVQGWRADQILSSELFDDQPLRSPEIQLAMDERTKLLSKQKLSLKDQKRLADLEGIVATLPVGNTPEERDVTEQLKAAAALLNRVTSGKP